MNMKLTARLALVLMIFALVSMTAVGALSYYSGRSSLKATAMGELESLALEKESALETWIQDGEAGIAALTNSTYLLRDLETLLEAEPGSGSAHDRLIGELAARTGSGQPFVNLFIVSVRNGRVVASVDPSEEGDTRTDFPYFMEGKKGRYTTDVYYSKNLHAPAMTTAAPLYAPDGQLIGILAGRLNLDELNEIIQRRSGMRQTDDAFLVNGVSLFVTQPRFIRDAAVLEERAYTKPVLRCLKGESNTLASTDQRNVPIIAAYRWLPARQMCLVVQISQEEAFAPLQQFGRKTIWMATGTLLLASVFALVLSNALLRPIRAMQVAAQRYGRGDLDIRLPEFRRDELGALAHEFNQMAGALAEKDAQLRAYARTLEEKVRERTQALQASHGQLQRAEEVAQIGSWEWLVSENRMIASEGLYTLLGLTAEEFGTTLDAYFERIHPDDLTGLYQVLQRQLEQPGPFELEARIIRADGQLRNVYARGNALVDEHGKPVRMTGVTIDITERKQAEEALRFENERFLRFVNSNIVGIAIADANGKITLANDYYLNILGVSRQQLLAGEVDWRRFTPPEWLSADEKAIEELLARGICEPYEKEYLRPDGTRVPVYLADAMLPGPDGQIAAFILDITDRKLAEAALQRTTEDLRRSNAELEQFAYVASHDLQEPLRMISSYLQLLAGRYRGRLDRDADEFIAYAVDGATRLQSLINDLLAYSRVGTRGHERVPVSAEDLLANALANLQFAREESGAVITHDPLPLICGDPLQLAMVFQNLLGNAIKFRSDELPCIHVGVQQESGEWVFSVRDNGIGFDPKFAERIFIIFQRLNSREAYPGTGIGLAICKRIILRHGGRIWVDSERGKGSVFYFTLPLAQADKLTKENV